MIWKWLFVVSFCSFLSYSNPVEGQHFENGPRVQRHIALPVLFLKSASFASKVSTAFTVVKKFIDFAGRVGSIIEIYDFVADQLRDPGAVSPELKSQFDKLQSEMNQIQMKIASLANLVKDEHLKTRYATAEKVIYHCAQMFNQYLASNGSERLLNEFRNTAKDLEAEIIYLLNGMAEKDLTLSGNLIKGISNSLRCRSKEIRSRIGQLMMLVTDGLVVHAAYRGLNNFTEHDNAPFKSHVNRTLHSIRDNLAKEVSYCRKMDKVEEEMEYILQENAQKGLDEVLDETFSYLSDKYDHHRWYVVAYQRSTKVNDDFQSYSRDAKILFDPDFYRTNLGDDYSGGFFVAALPLVPYDNPAMSSQATSLLQALCNNQLPWIDYSTDNIYKIYEQLTSSVNRYYRYVIIRPDAGAKIKRSEDLDLYNLPATNANKCKGWKDFVIATFPSKRPEDTLVPVQRLSILNSKGQPLIVADDNKSLTAVQQLANETTSIVLTVSALVESKTLWKFDGIQLKDEKGSCLDVMTNTRQIVFKNSLLTNIQSSVFLTKCNSQKFTQYWRREGTNIVGVYGCLSTSYHKKVDFDLDLQYPHLTPCSAISTESTQDWYFADNNLRTLWVNEVPRVNLKHWVLINGYNKALTVKDNRGTGWQWILQRNYNKEEGQEWRLISDGLLINRHNRCLMTNNKHWATQENCNEEKYNIGLRWTYKNNKLRNVFGCLTVKNFDDGSWIFVSKCVRNQLGQMWFLSEDGVSRAYTTRKHSNNVFNCPKTGHGEIKSIDFVMKVRDRERVTLTGSVGNNETRWYYENGRFHNGRCLCLFADVSQSVLVKPCDGFSLSEYWFFRGNQLWSTESVCLQREYFTAVKFRLKVAACNPKEAEQKWKLIS